jgi:hypothetical protein
MSEKKAPKIKAAKKAPVKKEIRFDTGCKKLDEKGKYNLTLAQRAMLKPKGVSISTIKEEMTGKELNEAMFKIKANAVSLGIVK